MLREKEFLRFLHSSNYRKHLGQEDTCNSIQFIISKPQGIKPRKDLEPAQPSLQTSPYTIIQDLSLLTDSGDPKLPYILCSQHSLIESRS